MSRVAVLMSTYNGNEYVKKQIESIYQQSFQDFTLYIRDDGSSEDFRKQLRSMQSEYGFILEEGDNVGFVKSFMNLLKNVKHSSYYAFADQDDIWLPDKLEKAVGWLETSVNTDEPLLYHSAYDVIDSEGKVRDHFYFPEEDYDFRRSITENHYSGFSMVINNKMRDMILKGNPDRIGYHDWWAAMIVKAFGRAYSDEQVLALHCSHGDNVTTFNFGTRLRWLADNLRGEQELKVRAKEFKRCFWEALSEDDRKILDMFCKERYSFKDALRKCFYPKRWRPVLSSELVMRFLMLLGKI